MFHACLFFFLSILIFLLYSTFAYRHHLLKLWLKHLHSRNSFTELVNLNWILLFQTGVFLHKITNNGVQCMLSQSIDSNSVLFFPIYSFILTVLCNFSIKCNMDIYIYKRIWEHLKQLLSKKLYNLRKQKQKHLYWCQ